MKNIIIIGGGFAGARIAQDLENAGFRTTLIDKKDYFEVTYATLRALVQPDMGKRSRMKYSDFIKGKFVQDEVSELKKDSVILSNSTNIAFDIAVIATGSSYKTFPIAKSQEAMTLETRNAEFESATQTLKDAKNILIIGGGAVGVELAGEIADHFPDKQITLTEGSNRLLGELKPKASELAEKQLKKMGVEIKYNTRLTSDNELYQKADIVYPCVGLTPNTALMQTHFADTLDDDGHIKVDDYFRIEGLDNIYALGDCANVPEGKRGYLADIQANKLAQNIIAKSKDRKTKSYKTNPSIAMIPIGRRGGFMQLPFVVTTLSFMIGMKQKDMFIGLQYKNLGVERKK